MQAPFKVIYVDDPRAFKALLRVWHEAVLRQDVFHLIDRFSREIDPDNTLKGKLPSQAQFCTLKKEPNLVAL